MNPDNLPDELYTATGVRELDRIAIEDLGIPAISLMRRAGQACVEVLSNRWPAAKHIWIMCGSGNNAGDGYIIAGKLAERHLRVSVRTLGDIAKASPAAMMAYEYCLQSGVVPKIFDPQEVIEADVIVDALLGTGLSGEVRPNYQHCIRLLNDTSLPILAVDIPSGLCADTGNCLGAAIEAVVTVTFIGLKRGLFTLNGPDCAGEVVYDPLGLGDEVLQQVVTGTKKLRLQQLLDGLPIRRRNSHKNAFGHVLIVGGDRGMGGAVLMSAEAALRAGAGLVTVATHPAHQAAMLSRCPELMVRGIEASSELDPLAARATVIVLGPGLGQSEWSKMVFGHLIDHLSVSVVDADGLNLLAKQPLRRDTWVLTPHPGEASRLLADGTNIDADRFEAARRIQGQYGGVVVLKGVGSLVADPSSLDLCPYGNPGMATAGMGDVLSGVIAALLAQGMPLKEASSLAVAVHAAAGDKVAEDGERGLLATDTIAWIRRLLNPAPPRRG